ncbi:MAG: molybdopterin adenylyltransferase [Chloroflexi bacterium]|nr:molybdopterin adenylyltransferase [Chloroflexota bacterium]
MSLHISSEYGFPRLSLPASHVVEYEIVLRVGILTISDKSYRGERIDKSGNVMEEHLHLPYSRVVKYEIVPDEVDMIAGKLVEWADSGEVDLVLTTGGTGLAPRDVTPEATLSILDKVAPGFGEAMRAGTFDKTPMAILSRATAGVRKRCLIINMPGNPKAVKECLEVILPAIPHAVEIITGKFTEHNVEIK